MTADATHPGLKLLDQHGSPLDFGVSSFQGAGTSAKELRDWNPLLASADYDLSGELHDLVARSRDMDRNNGIASGAIQTLVDNVVGTGLRMQSRPDYLALGWTKEQADAWAADVERKFKTWTETGECDATGECDFDTLTQLAFRTTLYNGEALGVARWLSQDPGRRWNTAIQMVDPDRLGNPNQLMNSPRLREGVEVDSRGRPVAYHIRDTHPMDVPFSAASLNHQRVTARMRNGRRRVIHAFKRERVGQHRGIPIFAPILNNFRMLDRYHRTELQSAVVNSLIAAFIETTASAGDLAEHFQMSFEQYANARQQWEGQLEGGAMLQLPPGDKMQPFTPNRPSSGFAEFENATLRHISTGLDMPYELLMKDYSKTNYSSARAALLEAWRHFTGRRKWLATYWAQPWFELWLEEAINRGEVSAPGFYENRHAYTRAQWTGPGRGWIDPVKEAEAAKLRQEAGVSTLQDEAAEQGRDWEEVLEQQARENERRRELGLPLVGSSSSQDFPSDNEQPANNAGAEG